MSDSQNLAVGQSVICQPSGIEGIVYAIAPGVVYVKLAKGEIITSPCDMLDVAAVEDL